MKKEDFTTKLIKRFYGIAGPLDEYKRQEVDKIGNICFIWLSWILMIGNILALLLASHYPEAVAVIYPILLELIILILFGVVMVKSQETRITEFDKEELDEQEKKQIKFAGLKAGLFFGFFMWFFLPFGSGQPYFSELFALKGIIGALISGFLFGISMHFMAKSRQK